ncbi:bacillithiol system redox-active protein YtxJ [Alteribacter natronophilus]|uniref:bacillithiol system redox-active protein YtxJ n=1 Tax=Alteribacter natronophilus TaxID=2583810 RepID=UPI00110F052D|nr:bacillithiol system redox-active protein YtxJ [Alteribacter natronophilus]TMW71753.1 bacillithiol system redox-active protein YtxJ [Alteribacter natronophilus]
MSLTKIETVTQWDDLSKSESRFVFLKNSTTCPISTQAFNDTEAFAGEHPDVPVYYLNVQESRSLSGEIAERYEVKHESPQAFLIENGEVKWHDSHWNITKDNLAAVWNKN